MQTEEVWRIFAEKKDEYLREMSSDNHPIGILLGGQGAVGKGRLNLWAERLYPENVFLAINGDNYRVWHPDFDRLRKNIWNYSKETQIFSNIFTEGLIEDATTNRYSLVVEGTMRSAEVPIQTAAMLRSHGYETAAFVIAACKEFSLLNAFVRYYKEVQSKGFGRMIDIESHNKAVEGLPKSVDRLYMEKSVDRICLFDCFAKNMIADYQLLDGKWSNETLPSTIVLDTREKQLNDKESIEMLLNEASIALTSVKDETIKELMQKAYDELLTKYQSRQKTSHNPQVVY